MIIRESVKVGDTTVTLETGRIARQAQGSVLVTCGETVVLVTACGTKEPRPGIDFLPLSVDYVEKTYAAGKIPGGFFKREGRLRDHEILTSRLIDRPCRPLFPDGYRNEIQVICTVLSVDKEHPSDVLGMIGASAALHISPIPWAGPIASTRVGRVDGKWVANPTHQQSEKSDVDIVISASRDAIVMVEGECDEISEEDFAEALYFGHRAVQDVIVLQDRMREALGVQKWGFTPKLPPEGLDEAREGRRALRHQGRLRAAREVRALRQLQRGQEVDRGDAGARVPAARGLHQGSLRRAEVQHDARASRARRRARRRPRPLHGASDQHRGRLPAAHARLGAVHARRDAGDLHDHARHLARSSRRSTA